ncbi:MAG: hypothetical protein ACLVJH_07495 [Faecalibacterium prausnitzii]
MPSSTDTSGADAYIDNRTDTLVVRAQHPSRKSLCKPRHLKLSPPQGTSTLPCCASCGR